MTRQDFNGLSEAQAEVLAHLAEECGEVVVAVGKILRHGLDSHHPDDLDGDDNSLVLSYELGDLQAAIDLVVRYGCAFREEVREGRRRKLREIGSWLHHATAKGRR